MCVLCMDNHAKNVNYAQPPLDKIYVTMYHYHQDQLLAQPFKSPLIGGGYDDEW